LNFLAFHHQSSPDELRVRLISEIQSLSCSESGKESLTKEFSFQADSETTRSVDALRQYLRQRQYGTRTHAYVELIHAARARPTQIRLLNRSDLHLEERTASIPLSETYLIAATGLHNEHCVDLSPDLTNVLETYIEYERETPSRSDCQPLFTTTHGRASVGTLRRGVKLASEKARDYHAATRESNSDDSSSLDSVVTVAPNDIYRVALNEVENTQ
jgi:integrase